MNDLNFRILAERIRQQQAARVALLTEAQARAALDYMARHNPSLAERALAKLLNGQQEEEDV